VDLFQLISINLDKINGQILLLSRQKSVLTIDNLHFVINDDWGNQVLIFEGFDQPTDM
jgi:hypothetical protein